jgi:S-DNA-T family DNA segregation ATPase FtsK/SpoIIIE
MNNQEKLQNILNIYGIDGNVTEVKDCGKLARYEVVLGEKQRIQPLNSLTADIGLAFGVGDTVTVEPMYSKMYTVAISIPNIREVGSQAPKTPTTVTIGDTVDGEEVKADIADMPHLLVAGTTGSGKSVFINSIIIELIKKNAPDTLQLVLIDPKQVELAAYRHLPHIYFEKMGVATTNEEAVLSLSIMVAEMEARYRLIEKAGCKGIDGYNKAAAEKLPKIIVVIDEFADLMLSAKKDERADTEKHICRLAQKARAAGIHLIAATQRPSREVITGLIKANFPTRAAFRVSNSTDSRIVLDDCGAEKLLGNGDMLFKTAQSSKLQRLQGRYVSDIDISQAVNGF